MWPSVPQMWLSHGCCQGCCASRQECRPRCGQGWRWGLGRGTELLLGFRKDIALRGKKRVFSVRLLKNLQPVPWGGKICTNKHTTLLHLKPRHCVLTLLQVLMPGLTSVHWYSCSWVLPATRGRATAAASVPRTERELSLLAQQVGIFPRLHKCPAFPGPQR